jgi:hypothetical protein
MFYSSTRLSDSALFGRAGIPEKKKLGLTGDHHAALPNRTGGGDICLAL